MSILRVKDNDGNIIPIPAIQGPPGKSGTIDETTVTTVSGLLKGSGGKISAAAAGTDYATPAQVNAKLDKAGGEVGGNLVPDEGGTRYLGSEAKRWNVLHAYTGYFNDDIFMGSAEAPVASSGSNSNGSWVKFYDGTMICWMTKDFGQDDVVNPWGVMFDGEEQRWPDFPVPFISTPTMMLCPEVPPNSASYILEGPKGVTSSSPGIFWASRPASAEGLQVVASYVAIGRWK
jgi:hypothetical protein